MNVEVWDTEEELATAVAREFLSLMTELQLAGKVPTVGLTGGSIADALHREVARLSPEHTIDWARIAFWWGDERFVPSGSSDRNAQQARAALLDVVGATQVHEVPSTDDVPTVHDAAERYAHELRSEGAEAFDVLMLGIGPDGHVASLFPHSSQVDATDAIAVGVDDSPKPPPARVTLTFEALNRSHRTWLVASGEAKAAAVAAALAPEGDVHDTPARGIAPVDGTLTWFLDRAATVAIR